MSVSSTDPNTGKPTFNNVSTTQADLQTLADYAEKGVKGETVETAGDLPGAGSWQGRLIWVHDTETLYATSEAGGDNVPIGGGDTGWIVDRASAPAISHRIRDGIVYVWVDGSFAAPNGADTKVASAVIPVAACPPPGPGGASWARAGAYITGRAGALSVNSAGDVYVSNYTGVATSSVAGFIIYPVN